MFLKVLKCIHKRFFEEFKFIENLPDVKEILSKYKKEIFSNFSFVFSGIFHQNQLMEEQEIWKLSREFGAECEYELSDKTTHLISNRIDTEKALESRERGIPAVRPEWIYESCRRWERMEEWKEYQLEVKVPSSRSKKRVVADIEDSGEEDDAEDDSEDKKRNNFTLPILDEADLEEIQKELEDLDSDSEQTVNSTKSFLEAELSDGDFSDLLNNCSDDEE